MNEQTDMQKPIAGKKTVKKGRKKLKFKELSKFWKGMVIGLTLTTLVSISAAIGYFMVNIYPLLGLMGV